MLPRDNGSAYEFRFAALPEPVEYYVEAGAVKSKTYKLDVTDLPGITNIKATYHFPSWLGLPDQVEDPGGDLRAVAGTVAEVTVKTDRPLKNGVIEMDDGSQITLDSGANGTLTAKVPIRRDGMYHFAAIDQGQSVRLSPRIISSKRRTTRRPPCTSPIPARTPRCCPSRKSPST